MSEGLRKAIEDLLEEYALEDFIYDVRDSSRVSEDEEFFKDPQASSWDHPHVVRFVEILNTLRASVGQEPVVERA